MSKEEEVYLESETSGESRNFHIMRADNELFLEESNVVLPVINVKRIKLPRGGENWEIVANDELVLSLKGTRFTNPEREFLRSVDGMKFLMSQFKSGKKSVVKIKEELRKVL